MIIKIDDLNISVSASGNTRKVYGIWMNQDYGFCPQDNNKNISYHKVDLYSVYTITDLSEQNPFTDILASQLLVRIPLVRRLGFTWIMSRKSYGELIKSRNLTDKQDNFELEGYPIIISDYIE